MRLVLAIVSCLVIAAPIAATASPQDWVLDFSDDFDRTVIGDDWAPWVVAGDPCGYCSVGSGLLNLKSQCACGADSPAGTAAQYVYPVGSDFRIVVRMNKATHCGWSYLVLSEDPNVFPPTRLFGLYLNGDGTGGGSGSVTLRMYLDGVPTGLDGMEYAFGVNVWNVWVLTKVGSLLTLEVGPTEGALSLLLEATEPTLLPGGYLTLMDAQAGVLTLVDYVEVYSLAPTAVESRTWGDIKKLYAN